MNSVDYSVLIIDDDIWMQRILSKTLQSYGFMNIYLASNGFEGLNLAIEYKPCLIVLDILMPELSGQLTIKILKSVRITKDIPVLMVSALSDTENLGLAVKSGTAGFVSKPFTRATIYEKLIGIFGKDKLDMIAKGEPYEPELDYLPDAIFKPKIENQPSAYDRKIPPSISVSEISEIPGKFNDSRDDEKRSIESIKKMLLKSKK